MYKWISEGEPDGIPSYCHTMVGVGGFVVNDKFQILVVSEKHYSFPHWKLPGGSVDPGFNVKFVINHFVSVYFQVKI